MTSEKMRETCETGEQKKLEGDDKPRGDLQLATDVL